MFFIPDHKIGFYFSQSTFDSVWVERNGKVVQALANLKDEHGNSLCKKDIDKIRPILEMYGINDNGPNDLYIINETAITRKAVTGPINDIKKRLGASPEKTFLIVFVIAGHGMQDSGHQVIPVNQLNP